MVLPATSASCTALRFAILARWRSASPRSSLIRCHRRALYRKRQARHHQHDAVRARRDALIEHARRIAKPPAKRIVRHDPRARLRWRPAPPAPSPPPAPLPAARSPPRYRAPPASDWSATASGNRPAPACRAHASSAAARSSGASTVRHPAAPRADVPRSAPHLVVARLCGRDIDPRRRERGEQALRITALARPRAADDEGDGAAHGRHSMSLAQRMAQCIPSPLWRGESERVATPPPYYHPAAAQVKRDSANAATAQNAMVAVIGRAVPSKNALTTAMMTAPVSICSVPPSAAAMPAIGP